MTEPLPSTPHDALFKAAFGRPDAAAAQFRALLREQALADLDLARLAPAPREFVDVVLRRSESDLLFTAPRRGEESFLYFLYEHRSTPNALLHLDALGYKLRIWERWLERNKETVDPRSPKLPPILAVVLYHGPVAWTGPRRFRDLLDLPEEPAQREGLASYCLDFELVVDDLEAPSDDELAGRGSPPLADLTLALFKHGRRGEDLLDVWRARRESVARLVEEPEWTLGLRQAALYTYVVGNVPYEDLGAYVAEVAGEQAGETVMTTAERLRQEGAEREAVRRSQEILLRQLRVKFGRDITKEVEDRVAKAPLVDLDAWLDRVPSATSLEEVFTE